MNELTLEELMGNVALLYTKYGKENIDSDKKLLLLYWRDIDKVEMKNGYFSTKDFIESALDPIAIIHAKMMLEHIGLKENAD